MSDEERLMAIMELVDDYAEAKIWEAGYEPPRPRAVIRSGVKRRAVIEALTQALEP